MLLRSYSPFPLYEKVASLTHCQFRRSERALSPDEGNTGESLAFKRGHSNERRDVADLLLTVEPSRVVWTGQVVIGSPPQTFNSQSLFWGNAIIKTNPKTCSDPRHVYHRYNCRWRYLWLDLLWKKPLRYCR